MNELTHHGIKGQKWGIRRFQNADGTLTDLGRKRLNRTVKKIDTMYNRSNMWIERKIRKLDKKGKNNKSNAMKYMVDSNKKRQQELHDIYDNINTKKQYKNIRKQDILDTIFGG